MAFFSMNRQLDGGWGSGIPRWFVCKFVCVFVLQTFDLFARRADFLSSCERTSCIAENLGLWLGKWIACAMQVLHTLSPVIVAQRNGLLAPCKFYTPSVWSRRHPWLRLGRAGCMLCAK